MSKTVVGLFSTTAQAEQVKKTLVADGYDGQNLQVMAGDRPNATTTGTATAFDKDYTDIGSGGGTGIGEKVSSFFRSLSGGDDDVHHHYATGVNEGGALLTATVADNKAAEVASLMKQNGARDIEGTYKQGAGGSTPVQTRDTTALTGETAIPIVEEELVVGKREVGRGGVRIYSHVVERPVEESVTLHEERINVERRPVNRPATAADFGTGDRSFELRATGEEAVVGKTSRVVEEVRVGKQGSDHTETVNDSVRKTEVEVEEIAGQNLGKTER